MAHEENRPQIHLTPDTSPAGRITNGIHSVDVIQQGDILLLQVSRNEQSLFSASVTPDNRVHLVFDAQQQTTPLNETLTTLPTIETPPAPEERKPPPITIEGYPIRPATYDKETRAYKLIIAHHPNPKDRKAAVYYDIVAQGDKAEELFKLYVIDTKIPVHITGDDLTRTSKRNGKPDKVIHIVQADTIEKFHGRKDSAEILRTKQPLADLS